MRFNWRRTGVVVLGVSLLLAFWGQTMTGFAFREEPATIRTLEEADAEYAAGNYKNALQFYRKAVVQAGMTPQQVVERLPRISACLDTLSQIHEFDDVMNSVAAAHPQEMGVLAAVAQEFLNVQHVGIIVDGKFERGQGRRQGQFANAEPRDRVRAWQLLNAAIPLAMNSNDKPAASEILYRFADALRQITYSSGAWSWTQLTDLSQLPDYELTYRYGGNSTGAPVNADGSPVFFKVPESWEAAANDGERWQWLLDQAGELNPAQLARVAYDRAGFFQQQFGVQTLAQYGWNAFVRDDNDESQAGIFSLDTLTDDETIARLATGIKRFKLPQEFNYIALLRNCISRGNPTYSMLAADQLASEYENRRQFVTAASEWKKGIEKFGPGNQNERAARLKQVVDPWGRFEGGKVLPAGTGATVAFRHRNASSVSFTAHPVDVPLLVADTKKYLESRPAEVDWQKINITEVGYKLVELNETKYIGKPVANWTAELKPREGHRDTLSELATPLQSAGAYLLIAEVPNGNISRMVVWLADTVIVQKQLDGAHLFYVADAVTGKPLPKINLEFFGWKFNQPEANQRPVIETRNFAEFTSADGLATLKEDRLPGTYQWMVVARDTAKNGKRFSSTGFENFWYSRYYDQEYTATKVFVMTDRPVYRPLNTVKFKFWIGTARYDAPFESDRAHATYAYKIISPTGDELYNGSAATDEFGGISGEYALPGDAKLGTYAIQVADIGGGNFRVEEYKKPEFEVTVDAPTGTVQLGDKITAKVNAQYLFGSPVQNARVKYKVLRSTYDSTWYPVGRWDWLYGKGYWWFAPDYAWYPGWTRWGCARPVIWWWNRGSSPPELVAEAEVPIAADGTIAVDIDTSVAKLMHGNNDHQYSITAEVTDESRRTIVGTGSVIVARKPFKVFAWVDRGHYRSGDVVHAQFQVQTIASVPVTAAGKLRLYKITYKDDADPEETLVEESDVTTDEAGSVSKQFKAGEPGQYRVSLTATDQSGRSEEGAYLFSVRGKEKGQFGLRFSDLELITDKREYADGEKVQLLVNTNRLGSTVLLFIRPSNGIYLPPQVLRIAGQSTLVEIPVTAKDMPNMFVEALCISDAEVHTELREVIVPPAKRIANMELLPSAREYRPGEAATLQLRVTDAAGKPIVGPVVLTMYDKAVEYISGGSNVGDIREFFWKWRRSHQPRTLHNLERWFTNLLKFGEIPMGNLGMFAEQDLEENLIREELSSRQDKTPTKGRRAGGAPGGGGRIDRFGRQYFAKGEMALGMPMPAAAPMESLDAADAAGGLGGGGAPEAEATAAVTIRKNFADTAVWVSALQTNSDGIADVSLTIPESLTSWKIKAWTFAPGTVVGEAETEVITRKNLLVRLQAPRFFVQSDEVVLSANVHNYLPDAARVKVKLETPGEFLKPISAGEQSISIPAGGEQRVDFLVSVQKEGTAVIRMLALSANESDAVEMTFPVYIHGMLKTDSYSGVIRGDDTSSTVTLRVPAERRVADSRLEVRFSPSLAGAMVDALPYFADYPYGCTEQTLNRFVPTIITQKILKDLKLDLAAIRNKQNNLNAQELGDPAARAAGWKRFDRNPVFDDAEVAKMATAGLDRLTSMQNRDGGWGWFSGYGEQSYPHTTATVVHGLQIAQQNGLALVPGMLERGVKWLENYQADQVIQIKNAAAKRLPYKTQADNLDALVYMILADAGLQNPDMRQFLYRDRTSLAVYAKAVFGLALLQQGHQAELRMILENISQFVQEDATNQTAWLQLPDTGWWYWHNSEIEAHSYYLKLLTRVDPQASRTSRLVKYLLNNRKHGTYWNSTRDSALAIEALAEYFVASGESHPNMTIEVYLDGTLQKTVSVSAAELFTFDNRFIQFGDVVTSGEHVLELRKKGSGNLYYNAYLTNFTLEEQIAASGLELQVQRRYSRLTPVESTTKVANQTGNAVTQRVEKFNREPLENLASLVSGDLIEIELLIESKNDYEYLLFEDMKASGLEPVEVRSGYTGNSLGAYMEFRDERVCFFVRQLPRGKHSVTYRLRAEVPGKFSALPTRASAMYAPELRGNSDEFKLSIEDRPPMGKHAGVTEPATGQAVPGQPQ